MTQPLRLSPLSTIFEGRTVVGAGGLPLALWERPGEGPLCLLLHGFLDLGLSWELVAEQLPPDWWLLAPDFRGHGWSDHIGQGGYYHFYDYVADISRLLQDLPTDRPLHLVGHSMGGTVSTLLAGTHPERFASLILLEGWGPGEVPLSQGPERMRRWLTSWRRARPNRSYPDVSAAAARLRGYNPDLPAGFAERLASWATRPAGPGRIFRHDPIHLTRAPRPFQREALAAFARAWQGPTALVRGGASGYQLDDLAERFAWFHDAREHELPGVGHMLHHGAAPRVAEIVLESAGRARR